MIARPDFPFEAVTKPPSGTAAPACEAPTLGDFAKALRAADLIDGTAVDVPGNYIVLPDGMSLVNRFRSEVTGAYESAGLREQEYPHVIPDRALEPLRGILGPRASTVRLAGREDLGLAPSGEATFYTHCARAYRQSRDYPIRTFRNATYFRPITRAHAGRSIFRSMEAHDVFEFFVADVDEAAHARTLRAMYDALHEIVRRLRLPVLLGIRPPWTNNGALYRWALGGDAVLPGGETVQLTTLYDQGDILARLFGVGAGAAGAPLVAAGSITRRSLFVHLLIGLVDRVRFIVHPGLAPAQAVVVSADAARAGEIAGLLRANGVRVETEVAASTRELFRRYERRWRQGVPVTLAVADSADGERLVLRRSDTAEETKLAGPEALVERIVQGIAGVAAAYDARAAAVYEHAIGGGACGCAAVLERIALTPTEAAVARVESGRRGEVLSFAPSAPARCAVTGETTTMTAARGRRL